LDILTNKIYDSRVYYVNKNKKFKSDSEIPVEISSMNIKSKYRPFLWLLVDILFIIVLFNIPEIKHPLLGAFIITHIYAICIATMVMFTGLGAGVLWFPYFTLIGCSPSESVTLSLLTQMAGKGSGSFQYLIDQMIDWKVVKAFIPYAIVGVLIGYMAGFVLSKKNENWLLLIFIIVVLYLIFTMIRSFNEQSVNPTHKPKYELLEKSGSVVMSSSFFTGLLSIGNSDWLIPYMIRVLKMPNSRAVATSIFIMFSVTVFFLFLTIGSIFLEIRYLPHLMPILWATCSGVVVGGQIGTRLVKVKIFQKYQLHAFIMMLIISELHMIWKFLSNCC